MASDIFKAQGGGINFVHGGSSPQEMLIPLIDVRTEKGHKETTNAVISLVSLSNKITNLIFSLDFIQNEPVGSVVKETTYRICFVNESGEKMAAIPNVFSVIQSESDSGAGFQYPDHLSGIFYHKAPAIVQKNPGMRVWSGAIAKAPQYFRFQGFAASGGTIGCHQAPLLGRSSTFPRSHCRRSPGL